MAPCTAAKSDAAHSPDEPGLSLRLCIFCYRNSSESESALKNCDNDTLCQNFLSKFVKLTSRFLTSGKLITAWKTVDFKSLGYCEDCGIIVEQFCELFHQISVLKLKLQWKLSSLLDIMTLANKVPSRMKRLRGHFKNGELKSFQAERNKFLKKCKQKLSRSFPRVVLERWEEEAAVKVKQEPDLASPFPVKVVEIAFGWAISLFAVALLASMTTTDAEVPSRLIALRGRQVGFGADQDDNDMRGVKQEWNGDEDEVDNEEESKLIINQVYSHNGDDDRGEAQHQTCDKIDEEIHIKTEDTESLAENNDDEMETATNWEEFFESQPILERIEYLETSGVPTADLPTALNGQETQTQEEEQESENSDVTYYSSSDEDTSSSSDANSTIEKEGSHPRRKRGRPPGSKSKKTSSLINPSVIASYIRKRTRKLPNYLYCELDSCTFKLHRDNPINPEQFQDHQNLHVSGSFKCNLCEHVAKNLIQLSAHQSFLHSDLRNLPPTPTQTPVDSDPVVPNLPEILEQNNNNIQRRRFKCKLCDKIFPTYYSAQQHKIKEHKKQLNLMTRELQALTCPVTSCNHSYKTKRDLTSHLKLHGHFSCTFCKQVESYAPQLVAHEQTHLKTTDLSDATTVRKFPCSRCKLTFDTGSACMKHHLKVHLRLASKTFKKLKRVTCQICGAKFANEHFHRIHYQQSHCLSNGRTTSSIFRCSFCPAYFVTKAQLYHHTGRRHLKQERCKECGLRFGRVSELRRHFKERHPSLSLSSGLMCQFCGVVFISYLDWNAHVKTEHGEN